ncbi:MAG: glycosyltransferase family 2 protein [Bacteroidota bacterium]
MNNFFSLIICTYNRSISLRRLLDSVKSQTKRFDEIIVVDASENEFHQLMTALMKDWPSIHYHHVNDKNKGLTKQRNFGVSLIHPDSTHTTFLDDDLVLDADFLLCIEKAFANQPDAIGISGLDMVENRYFKPEDPTVFGSLRFYRLGDWVIKDPLRYILRKIFGLMSDYPPEIIPPYGHGRNGYPPDGNIYPVDHIMGGIATYQSWIFQHISFSERFTGYGLYEDFDFSVRASAFGNLYVNTNAKVHHHHDPSGRPNYIRYGRMVVRNGWYVWRVKHPDPTLSNKMKWHAITLLLALVLLISAFTTLKFKRFLFEFIGRLYGWFSLFFISPIKRL